VRTRVMFNGRHFSIDFFKNSFCHRCIDRSEFPEKCDEDGWTYGYNFTDFGNKDALGSGTAKALMVCCHRFVCT
jgi:hypothetical protein